MYEKTKLTFETYQTEEHGYKQTHVVIREMYEERVEEALEGTVDNKAGYGTMYHAEQAAKRYRLMQETGHEVFYNRMYHGLVVHLRWQHYDIVDGVQTYCRVTYDDLGETFAQLESAMAMVKKLAKGVANRIDKDSNVKFVKINPDHYLDRPENLLEHLRGMKQMVQIERDATNWLWVRKLRSTRKAAA